SIVGRVVLYMPAVSTALRIAALVYLTSTYGGIVDSISSATNGSTPEELVQEGEGEGPMAVDEQIYALVSFSSAPRHDLKVTRNRWKVLYAAICLHSTGTTRDDEDHRDMNLNVHGQHPVKTMGGRGSLHFHASYFPLRGREVDGYGEH
ncbi:hypothetical protein B0H16DRAFT_1533358, partial [Mycena metata]